MALALNGMSSPLESRSHFRAINDSEKIAIESTSTDVEEMTESSAIAASAGIDDGKAKLALKATLKSGGKVATKSEEKVSRDVSILRISTYGPDTEPHWRCTNTMGQPLEHSLRCSTDVMMSDNAMDSGLRIETQADAIVVKIVSAVLETYSKKQRAILEAAVHSGIVKRLGSFELYRAIISPVRAA